jgi:hypothetical protein
VVSSRTLASLLWWILRHRENERERGGGGELGFPWWFPGWFYMSRKGRGGHLAVGDGWDASGMDALVLGANHFAAAASWLGVDQDEVVAVNSVQRWSSMTTGTWLRHRAVDPRREEEDDGSPLPCGSRLAAKYRNGMPSGLRWTG